MPLRIQDARVVLVYHAVNVSAGILDVVVQRVSHFTAGDVPREIPDQPVVERKCPHRRQQRVIAPAQQFDFFFQQRGCLVHETMQRCRLASVLLVIRAKRDRRVRRVRVSLVRQHHI